MTKYPGATKGWKVQCLMCYRVSTASWITMQLKRKNAGCSSRTEFRFKPLKHKDKTAHEVGIGNKNVKRIEQHQKNGQGIYKVLEFKRGEKANLIEQTVIEWLRIEKEIGPAFRAGMYGSRRCLPIPQPCLRYLRKLLKQLAETIYLFPARPQALKIKVLAHVQPMF